MEKLTTILLSSLFVLILSFSASGQNYKSFEWDIVRFGYVIPSGDGTSGGIAISTEPRFNIADNLSLGLRAEFALFGAEDGDLVDIGASGSYALMADYYFNTTSSTRAFAGIGFGTFSGGDVTITTGGVEQTAEGASSIGLIPRVGYELGHLRVSLEYNYTFKSEVPNYFGVHLGITIGGGYKG